VGGPKKRTRLKEKIRALGGHCLGGGRVLGGREGPCERTAKGRKKRRKGKNCGLGNWWAGEKSSAEKEEREADATKGGKWYFFSGGEGESQGVLEQNEGQHSVGEARRGSNSGGGSSKKGPKGI